MASTLWTCREGRDDRDKTFRPGKVGGRGHDRQPGRLSASGVWGHTGRLGALTAPSRWMDEILGATQEREGCRGCSKIPRWPGTAFSRGGRAMCLPRFAARLGANAESRPGRLARAGRGQGGGSEGRNLNEDPRLRIAGPGPVGGSRGIGAVATPGGPARPEPWNHPPPSMARHRCSRPGRSVRPVATLGSDARGRPSLLRSPCRPLCFLPPSEEEKKGED